MTDTNTECSVVAAPRHRIVAIDFGTHSSGFATGTAPSARVVQHEDWPDQPQRYPKTRSALLFRDRTPIAWGWTARKQLLELAADEVSRHWYIEDFKLALQDETQAAAIRSKGLTCEQVIADYLRLFTEYVKQQLVKAHGVRASELDNIQWCMTVPAMWTEASKSAMRKAAVRAGLIRTADSDALTIILEPEAAALHAMDTKAPPLNPGMSVCVLDVGGGTADITVHNVVQRNGTTVLAEAVAAHGELCGSCYVDQAFKQHHRDVIGQDIYDGWSEDHPEELQQVMDRWMTIKHDFKLPAGDSSSMAGLSLNPNTPSGTSLYRLPIPANLLDLLPVSHELKTSGVLLLSDRTIMSLFEQPVSKVVEAAAKQLQQLGKPCSLVLLVGGFAASPLLQQRVKQALVGRGLTHQVHVPPQPYAAVLRGAVLYGCSPTTIHARRSRLAYGVSACRPCQPGDTCVNKQWIAEEGCYFVTDHFCRLVAKDELVEQDQEVEHYFMPLHASQTNSFIDIYATDDNSLKYVGSQSKHLGTLSVTHPSSPSSKDLRVIKLSFKFGATELLPTAWDVNSGARVTSQFKFAHYH